jgi:preprotein translocase subunit SecG
MKSVLLVTAALLLSVSLFGPAFAQPTQVSYTVNLNWFSLQVTYPAEVVPGGTVSVSVQGTPKSSRIYLQSLTGTVYFADSVGLHLIATQMLVSNPVNGYGFYGSGSFSNGFTVSVPQNASRTSLVAVFSETVQLNYYALYYGYVPYYGYGWYPNLQYGWYPSYSLETRTDDAIAPLSYIKATTPEYVSLQSTYQTLQQQLNQTQTRNQQLQTTITQQSAMISQLNQQLTSANTTTQTYQIVAAIFVVIAVALAALSIYQLRNKRKLGTQPSDSAATATSARATPSRSP